MKTKAKNPARLPGPERARPVFTPKGV